MLSPILLALVAGVTASAATQTIAFDSIPNQILGVSPFPITAQATSGLPVSFASNIPAVCTVADGLVMLLSVGTCSITATQSGTTNLDPISVTHTFSVTQAKHSSGFAPNPKGPFATAKVPEFVAVGDFNGDGIDDAVIVNAPINSLTVLLGDGAGGFTMSPASPIALAAHPTSVVTGDFNLDGISDIALTFYNGTIAVMLGDGRGGFTQAPGSPIAMTGGPVAIAVGDFNGDGLLDLATANRGNATLSILPGNGLGGFSAAAVSPVRLASAPSVLTVGDFNGDGIQDLATATDGGGTIVVLGDGSGGFTTVTSGPFAPVSEVPASIVVGDFNGDGIQDLAVADFYENTITVSLGTGTGGFTVSAASTFGAGLYPSTLIVGDFNGDGFQDLVALEDGSNSVTLFLGNGSGQFTLSPGQYSTGSMPASMMAGDFNSDGILDLMVTNTDDSNVTVLLGVTTGSKPQTITFGSLNNVTFGIAPFPVTAISDSGLPVSFASATPTICTVAGNTLTLVLAGLCTVVAGQPGDATYGPAAPVSQSFTVSVVDQTITFGPLSDWVFGTPLPALNATASSGRFVEYASNSTSVCTVNGNIITLAGIGTCSITASQNGSFGTYNAAPSITRTFLVTKPSISITPDNIPVLSAATNIIVSGSGFGTNTVVTFTTSSIGGAVIGVGTTSQSTQMTATIPASFLTSAGTAEIAVYYYAGHFFTDSVPFTIAPLTVTAQTISFGALSNVPVGTAPFALSATASSGLPVTFASGTSSVCTVSDVTVTILAAGTCSITATQSGKATYAVAPSVTQSFTVITPVYQVTVTVSPANAGTVMLNPAATGGYYAAGSTVCLTASPAAGQIFTGWSGSSASSISGNCLTLTANASVTADFEVSPITASSALRFVPAAPCRLVDTRNPVGPLGGPSLGNGATRSFTIPGTCNIPSTALAYSLNLTVVPQGTLGYVTLWPTGQSQPGVSTLNSLDGRVKSNAAIVPAGTGGAVSVFATDTTDVILDINGYFDSYTDPSALQFYPLTPCRVADTRNGTGSLGGPSLLASQPRSFPIMSSACGIPANALAYSLNFTAIPQGPLGYLTVWPNGQSQPVVSTLNAPTGAVTANAAIVPAGTGGSIKLFATDNSDMAIDINGYFAAPASGGLSLYALTPCRIEDTRLPAGTPAFTGTVTETATGGACGVPPEARSLVLNATVVPSGELGYLSLWANGGSQPVVSTLNSLDGSVTSNMAVVPTSNGLVNAYAAGPAATYLILDIAGYFAP